MSFQQKQQKKYKILTLKTVASSVQLSSHKMSCKYSFEFDTNCWIDFIWSCRSFVRHCLSMLKKTMKISCFCNSHITVMSRCLPSEGRSEKLTIRIQTFNLNFCLSINYFSLVYPGSLVSVGSVFVLFYLMDIKLYCG